MKTSFKISFALLILAILTVSVSAQPGNRGNRADMDRMRDIPADVRINAQIAVFDEYLDLTETQKAQLKELDQEFAQKRDELREEKIDPRKKRVKAEDLRKEHQLAIHDILTKDQFAVFLEKREAIQYDIRQHLKKYANENGAN